MVGEFLAFVEFLAAASMTRLAGRGLLGFFVTSGHVLEISCRYKACENKPTYTKFAVHIRNYNKPMIVDRCC